MNEEKQPGMALREGIRRDLHVDRRYLVGVSGGRDSMALLAALRDSGFENLVVAHLNHGLRGADSDEDEKFVESAALEAGLLFSGRRVDVAAESSASGVSVETAARELRYLFFAEMAEKHDCKGVVVAHHAEDQVETIIMNFFRGSGTRGLTGMEPRSSRIIDGRELRIFRPWLKIPRAEIERYVAERGIPFREDESNAEENALRNRVRHRLMPMLDEVFGRDVRGAVIRSAEVARRLEAWAEENEGELPRKERGLDVGALREMPAGQRDRLLLSWLREEGVPDCGFEEVGLVSAVLMSNDRPAKANLPGARHVRRREGILFLE